MSHALAQQLGAVGGRVARTDDTFIHCVVVGLRLCLRKILLIDETLVGNSTDC